MHFEEYIKYDGLGLASLVQHGDVQPKELFEVAIQAISQFNPILNAVIHPCFDLAEKQLQGMSSKVPFAGVPFLIKDAIAALAGTPMSCGSRYLSHSVWDHDTELVKRYKQSGLVIMGKTNLPEFGLSATTEPKWFGATKNPWSLQHTAGGSSGGSAAAVAVGMVPMAHGGDGAGSLRVPASCCGLFGFKPTRGRLPTGPDYGRLWQGMAVDHAITRTVRDSAMLLDISCGEDLGAPLVAPMPKRPYLLELQRDLDPLKIALVRSPIFMGEVDSRVITAVEDTAHLCQQLGHHVEEVTFPIDKEKIQLAFLEMLAAELAASLSRYRQVLGKRPRRDDLELTTRILRHFGKQYSATEFLMATQRLERFARHAAKYFQAYDVILTPTLATPPVELGSFSVTGKQKLWLNLLDRIPISSLLKNTVIHHAKTLFSFTPYTALFNITGQPAMSVPLHWTDDNLPMGSQFAGRFGDEATLFRLARQLEEARPWFDNRPAMMGT